VSAESIKKLGTEEFRTCGSDRSGTAAKAVKK
jgi:hypothetical protein